MTKFNAIVLWLWSCFPCWSTEYTKIVGWELTLLTNPFQRFQWFTIITKNLYTEEPLITNSERSHVSKLSFYFQWKYRQCFIKAQTKGFEHWNVKNCLLHESVLSLLEIEQSIKDAHFESNVKTIATKNVQIPKSSLFIKTFRAMGLFLYPLKTRKSLAFGCFQEV